ncbi:MAG TPA: hypothetical protein VEX68_14120 [Bryobacteraceae bacterium]|nr:hypothetical protein [Bryobacteraceae bacterium]
MPLVMSGGEALDIERIDALNASMLKRSFQRSERSKTLYSDMSDWRFLGPWRTVME